MSSPQLRRVIIPADTRDISSEVLDDDGRIKVLPAEFWRSTTVNERARLGNAHGIYSFPTLELVDRLQEIIDGRSAIEIGAGNGVLAQALGIPATDNFQQRMPQYAALYASLGVATVPYGPNVVEMDANCAVRHYQPEVVIGCWVTHKWEKDRHWAGGNEIGVDEEDILRNCQNYVMIGNTDVHATQAPKKIWSRPHTLEHPDYLFSQALNGSLEFIANWEGLKRRA